MARLKEPTSTSMAVLALLAVRPATAYELANQVGRSLRHVWPRAVGRIYDEPKLLVAHGLATATPELTGRRPRTIYAITADGRTRLTSWLREPGAALVLEYEALLKVAFSEHGGKAALVANLDAIAEHAATNLAFGRTMGTSFAAGESPFPERAPLNSVMWSFLWMIHGAMADWAAWARAEVDRWPDDLHADPDAIARAMAHVRSELARRAPAGAPT